MEFLILLGKTLLLRPYVFLFLAVALATSVWLMGPKRTAIFFLLTWLTAFLCEFSSTRTGIPFGWYFYTGSTRGQELYLSNMPFMDSLSFSFLLFMSYCLALVFLLPGRGHGLSWELCDNPAIRRSGQVLALTTLCFVLLDVVIDPVTSEATAGFSARSTTTRSRACTSAFRWRTIWGGPWWGWSRSARSNGSTAACRTPRTRPPSRARSCWAVPSITESSRSIWRSPSGSTSP